MKQFEYVGNNKNFQIINDSPDMIKINEIENILKEPSVGFDKTLRNNKNTLLNTFDEVDIESNFFEPFLSENNENLLGKAKISRKTGDNNLSSKLIETSDLTLKSSINNFKDTLNSNKFEDFLLKNSKNLTKYKNEGCLVVFDERQEIQKNYKIDFTDLMNILTHEPSATENFIDGSKGKWIDEFGTEKKQNFNNINSINDFDENCNFQQDFIEFESRFESGNLRMAIQIDENEYDLILRNDINSEKTSKWFFFEIKMWINIHKIINNQKSMNSDYKNTKIIFNIINLQKKETFFSKGLRVLKYSAQSKKWSRDTYDIYYFPNGISLSENKSLYTLTFSFDFIEKNATNNKITSEDNKYNDPIIFYFSYCFPYTFSNLNNYLQKIHFNSNVKVSTIGKSLCNNPIYLLNITNFESSSNKIAERPAIILTARIHPGESNSSIVIQGVIDFLISKENSIAKELRDAFIFIIVPMLNPDGVINGNYRSCVNGKDLNRMWVDPRENLCPTLYYTKEMIKNTLKSRKVYLFCDFHGHSNKNNFFIFGCPIIRNEEKTDEELFLPEILNKLNDCFDKDSCIFKISKGKMKTARAVLKNEFDIKYSYCMESSICGITIGEKMNRFFSPEDYLKIGMDFCMGIREMWKKEGICNFVNEINLGKLSLSNENQNTLKRNKKKSKTNESNKNKNGKIAKKSNRYKNKNKENDIFEIRDDDLNKQTICLEGKSVIPNKNLIDEILKPNDIVKSKKSASGKKEIVLNPKVEKK